jgi:hypothetical protein
MGNGNVIAFSNWEKLLLLAIHCSFSIPSLKIQKGWERKSAKMWGNKKQLRENTSLAVLIRGIFNSLTLVKHDWLYAAAYQRISCFPYLLTTLLALCKTLIELIIASTSKAASFTLQISVFTSASFIPLF